MQKEVGVSVSCKDGGVLLNSGFPRDGGMANEERAKTTRTWCKHMVHLIHARASHRGRLGFIPLKRAFRSGSSSTKEVVVHGP